MCDKDTRLVSIEVSLIDSVAKAEMKGLAADATELTIDAVLNDELLKAIPIVGTIARVYRSAITIRDRLFLRKVLSFLNELANIPEENRQRFAQELEEDSGTRAKAGAALALLLERLDDLEKPEVIGRLYRAKLERRISFEELQRFCMIVERAYLPDLATLSHFRPGDQVNETAAPHLNALGLVSQTGEDYGTFDGLGAKTWYEVNDLGRKFLAVAYPEHGA